MSEQIRSDRDDVLSDFPLDTLRRELLASLAVIDRTSTELRGVIASLADDAESLAETVMSGVVEIEETANYAGRLFAIYAHRQLGVSLARLSKRLTPSALRRRIMADETEGIERPERFERSRDADAVGPNLTHYEVLCREAGLHPWPATVPLPSRRERQLRKNPD
ncbi:MAG: hypothetical protein ABI298_09025, partial [Acidimicrobiales bacterium]